MTTLFISAESFNVTSVPGTSDTFGYGYSVRTAPNTAVTIKGQIGVFFQPLAGSSVSLTYGVPTTVAFGSVTQEEVANSGASYKPPPLTNPSRGKPQSYGLGALDEAGNSTYSPGNQPVYTTASASSNKSGFYSNLEGTAGNGLTQIGNTIASPNSYLDVPLQFSVGEQPTSLVAVNHLATLPRLDGVRTPIGSTGNVTLYHGYVADPEPDYILSLGSTSTKLANGDNLSIRFNPVILSNNPETEPLTATLTLTQPKSSPEIHPGFDPVYYLANNPDVAKSGMDPYQHYENYGWHEGRNPDALFSTIGYLAVNPDVKAANVDPLAHYDQHGWKEGRNPGPNFDTKLYLQHNLDVQNAKVDPLQQYLDYGQFETRMAFITVGSAITHNGFDAEYYLLANPDVARSGLDPYSHFETFGWHEGRDPNAFFNVKYYLTSNSDVAAANIDPLQHYDQYGWHEGRNPSAVFSTASYLAVNTDVRAAGINPLVHYEQGGIFEGRTI